MKTRYVLGNGLKITTTDGRPAHRGGAVLAALSKAAGRAGVKTVRTETFSR